MLKEMLSKEITVTESNNSAWVIGDRKTLTAFISMDLMKIIRITHVELENWQVLLMLVYFLNLLVEQMIFVVTLMLIQKLKLLQIQITTKLDSDQTGTLNAKVRKFANLT